MRSFLIPLLQYRFTMNSKRKEKSEHLCNILLPCMLLWLWYWQVIWHRKCPFRQKEEKLHTYESFINWANIPNFFFLCMTIKCVKNKTTFKIQFQTELVTSEFYIVKILSTKSLTATNNKYVQLFSWLNRRKQCQSCIPF